MTPVLNASEPFVDLPREGDWQHVAANMRQADRDEVAALRLNPEEALKGSILFSEVLFTIRRGDEPLGMFGVADRGAVWMLGTDGIKDIRYTFLRQSSTWVNALHSASPALWNWVDARNELHIRWLKWLGFKFTQARPLGANGETFRHFYRLSNHV